MRIESPGQAFSLISTVSLEPEPIPLDVRVILLGDRRLYYLLSAHDPEFEELFKVAADFDDQLDRGAENDLLYARLIATLARREKLRPLDRGAVARVVEYSARLVGDSARLSMRASDIADLMGEADHWAGANGNGTVRREDVQKAVNTRIFRHDQRRKRLRRAIFERGSRWAAFCALCGSGSPQPIFPESPKPVRLRQNRLTRSGRSSIRGAFWPFAVQTFS